MNRQIKALNAVKKIIKRWQGQIDFQKKDKAHYKLYKSNIDEQQKEVDALTYACEVIKRVDEGRVRMIIDNERRLFNEDKWVDFRGRVATAIINYLLGER